MAVPTSFNLFHLDIVMDRCQGCCLSNGFSVTIACQARATRSVGNHAIGEFGAAVTPTGWPVFALRSPRNRSFSAMGRSQCC